MNVGKTLYSPVIFIFKVVKEFILERNPRNESCVVKSAIPLVSEYMHVGWFPRRLDPVIL